MTTTETATFRTRLDPVLFEVLRHSFVTLADEMGLRLFRASFSPPVNQGRDYSIALFDPLGNLVTAGRWDMPIHFGTFQYTIQEVRRVIGDDTIAEGDIYLFNDPYTGGTHNQDVRACRPIFHDGKIVAWLVAMAHWADVGGPVPGSFNPQADDCYSEGIRITPIRVFENNEPIVPVIELIMANIRVPDERRGDLHAQAQTLFSGEQRFLGLVEKYGVETLHTAFEDCWDYAERTMRAHTEKLPNGSYSFEDRIDQDTMHPDKPPVTIRLTMIVKDGHLTFDFSETDTAPIGPVGASLPSTWSGVLLTILNLFPGVPLNHGLRRVIDLKTVPGSAVHVLPPNPCSGMACGALEKIISATVGAVGLADPDRKMGCMFNLVNITMGGFDERFGRPYVMYIWSPGGFGGSARGDLPMPTNIIFGPGVRTQPIEILERFYPVVFKGLSLREGSAGAGMHQGGWGTEIRWELTHGTASLGIMGDRKDFPIWGVEGGLPGQPQDLIRDEGREDEYVVGMFAAGVKAQVGSEFVCLTGGGGGYGDPLERDPAKVLEDVSEELLTCEQALDRYGVVVKPVDPDIFIYDLDTEATTTERARRRAA